MNERGTNPLRRLYGGIPLNQFFKEELLILQLSACYGRDPRCYTYQKVMNG